MKADNAGFYAIGTLVLVLLFIGMRSVDENGQFSVGRGPVIGPPAVLIDAAGETELFIEPGRGGHFYTEVRLNGAPVEVVVDTGATTLVIPESAARLAGIYVAAADFKYPSSTANGEVLGARAMVDTMTLGPAMLTNVEVYILPDEKLEGGLLGMNVLNRFGRMEVTATGLSLSVQ